ncbi:VOC family protein [Brevundimonas naejangsanensis]|uniref:VOC family protein n=1 Tax=Brevundimonas naejangsanensis TaxID=588932 RepID=A0A494RIJ2_9CAUL|nr:VOC family protein [Brevundimonas naejangsanensis]AYG93792.1 VOC family protein [Brevundimonas naejangsanensis]
MTTAPPQRITPCLWFDGQAEEAAAFYVSLFPDSRIDQVARAPTDYPGGKAGDALTVAFTLNGVAFTGLNGGPYFKFNEAVSFQIDCEDQVEMDRMTNALSAVPEAEQCGWVKDRYGLSWQIVPRRMSEMLTSGTPDQSRRLMEAMMPMKRLDLAALERAWAGG